MVFYCGFNVIINWKDPRSATSLANICFFLVRKPQIRGFALPTIHPDLLPKSFCATLKVTSHGTSPCVIMLNKSLPVKAEDASGRSKQQRGLGGFRPQNLSLCWDPMWDLTALQCVTSSPTEPPVRIQKQPHISTNTHTHTVVVWLHTGQSRARACFGAKLSGNFSY